MGTRPKADLTDDIERNGHDKRQRTPQETARPATVAAVLSPYVQGPRTGNQRDSDSKLGEAVGLARAIDLDVQWEQSVPLRRVTPATLIGKGVAERVKIAVEEQGIDLSQYREGAVSQVTIEGELYGIPEFYNIVLTIAADNALESAGLGPDAVDTSDWDALSQLNEQLTRVENGEPTRLGFDPKLPEFFPLWVRANGGELLSGDGRTALLNTPEALEALTYTLSLHEAAGGRQAFVAFRDTWDFFGAEN